MTLSDLALTITCTYCGAQPDQPCRTVSGGRATWPHCARRAPVEVAWLDGYLGGRADLAHQYRAIGSGPYDTLERFESVVDRALLDLAEYEETQR